MPHSKKTTLQNNPIYLLAMSGILLCILCFLLLIFVSFNSEGETTITTVDVNNAQPVVSNVIIATSSYGNAAASLNLTEAQTTPVFVHGLLTDNNGCEDISPSGTVEVFFFRTNSSVCPNNPVQDEKECYYANQNSVNCSFGTTDSGNQNQCVSGGTDTTVSFECQFDVYFFADATGSGGTYNASNWSGLIIADDVSVGPAAQSSSTAEIEVLTAISVSSSINYGNVSLNASSSDVGLGVRNTGNEELDVNFAGLPMPCSLIGTIAVGQQRYATGSVDYNAKTVLTGSSTLFELNLPRQTTVSTFSTDTIYWQIKLPASGVAGQCQGTSTITSIQST